MAKQVPVNVDLLAHTNDEISKLPELVKELKESFRGFFPIIADIKKSLSNTKVDTTLNSLGDELENSAKNIAEMFKQTLKEKNKQQGKSTAEILSYLTKNVLVQRNLGIIFGDSFQKALSTSITNSLGNLPALKVSLDTTGFNQTLNTLDSSINNFKTISDNLQNHIQKSQPDNSQPNTASTVTGKTSNPSIKESDITPTVLKKGLNEILQSFIVKLKSSIRGDEASFQKDEIKSLKTKILDIIRDAKEPQLRLDIGPFMSKLVDSIDKETIDESGIKTITNEIIKNIKNKITGNNNFKINFTGEYGNKTPSIPLSVFIDPLTKFSPDKQMITQYRDIQRGIIDNISKATESILKEPDNIEITKTQLDLSDFMDFRKFIRHGQLDEIASKSLLTIRTNILSAIDQKTKKIDITAKTDNKELDEKSPFNIDGSIKLSTFLPKDDKLSGQIATRYRALQGALIRKITNSIPKEIDVKSIKLPLDKLIPSDIKADKAATVALNAVRTSLLTQLKSAANNTEFQFDNEMNVSDVLMENAPDATWKLFGSVPWAYSNLRKNLLSKISKSVEKIPNDYFMFDDSLTVSQFLNEKSDSNSIAAPITSFITIPRTLANIKKQLLTKASKASETAKFEFGNEISVADFLTEDDRKKGGMLLGFPGYGAMTQLKKKLITKISDSVKDANFSFEPITTSEFLGIDQTDIINRFLSSRDIRKARQTILSDITKRATSIDNSSNTSTSTQKQPGVTSTFNSDIQQDISTSTDILKEFKSHAWGDKSKECISMRFGGRDRKTQEDLLKGIRDVNDTIDSNEQQNVNVTIKDKAAPIDKLEKSEKQAAEQRAIEAEDLHWNKMYSYFETMIKLPSKQKDIRDEKKDEKEGGIMSLLSSIKDLKSLKDLKNLGPFLGNIGRGIMAAGPALATAAGITAVLGGTAYVGYLGKQLIEQNAANKLAEANLKDVEDTTVSQSRRKKFNRQMQAKGKESIEGGYNVDREVLKRNRRIQLLDKLGIAEIDREKYLKMSDDDFEKTFKGKNESAFQEFDTTLRKDYRKKAQEFMKQKDQVVLEAVSPAPPVKQEIAKPVEEVKTVQPEINNIAPQQFGEFMKQNNDLLRRIEKKPPAKLMNIVTPMARKGLV